VKRNIIPLICLLIFCCLNGGCVPTQNFDSLLNATVKPHRFSVATWEYTTIANEINQYIFASNDEEINDDINTVIEYFSSFERIKTLESEIRDNNTGNRKSNPVALEAELNTLREQRIAMQDSVERILERQIKATLIQQGILNPVDPYLNLKISFPPVNFELAKPPLLLVVSPRHRIESMREILLQPNLSTKEKESIEAEVDELDVSSLVVELGGIAMYPALVTNEANLRSTINTAIEEWLHQYLAFTPLGFLYLLDTIGVSRNYEIATMNETAVGIMTKEISAIVYEKYYSQYGNDHNESEETDSEFDFNYEMREIRRAVDEYLAKGQVEKAEEFMEEKRQYLASKGYYIRKLNQAYFAFHGTYANKPTSISPIGIELRELRSQSISVKDFLDKVATLTSRQDLLDSIK